MPFPESEQPGLGYFHASLGGLRRDTPEVPGDMERAGQGSLSVAQPEHTRGLALASPAQGLLLTARPPGVPLQKAQPARARGRGSPCGLFPPSSVFTPTLHHEQGRVNVDLFAPCIKCLPESQAKKEKIRVTAVLLLPVHRGRLLPVQENFTGFS